MTDYLEIARQVAAQAAAQGVEAEAFIMDQVETDIQISQGEVEKLSQSGERGLGVRVINDGKMGYAYTSDFSAEGLEKTWRAAVELAAVATPDERRGLPALQPIPEEDLAIWDESLAGLSTEQKVAFIQTASQAAREADARIFLVPMAQYFDNIFHVYLANSNGFAGSFGKTYAGGVVLAVRVTKTA
ncbi:MAG: hypothetical protein HC915_18980 [Anaerolineae bacterium]|nr:hypothetical protein [Anaerolineae bacterium]